MSKKCCEPEESFSSKEKLSRCRRNASRGRSSSSRSEKKSQRKRKEKKFDFDSAKSSLTSVRSSKKKQRIETSVKSDIKNPELLASGGKKRRKKKKRQKAKRKNIDINKKKRTDRREKLSESSASSRLIEIFLKCCSCLKSFEASTLPNNDGKCFCKCRFCRPDCESKFVQCDDCSNFVISENETEGSPNLTNEKTDESWELENCQSDIRTRKDEKKIKKREHKSDIGLRSSICKRFSSIRNCGKRRVSTKSLIDDRKLLENRVEFDSSKFEASTSKEIAERFESKDKNSLACKCDSKNRIKSTKPLSIMFDIVFWPYACLSGKRRSFDDEHKRK